MAMALVIGVIAYLCCEKYGLSTYLCLVLGIVFITLIMVVSLIVTLIKGRYSGVFTLSKYEIIILGICIFIYVIGTYRCSYISRIYEKYDRIQYEQGQDKSYVYKGEVKDVEKSTHGYMITLQMTDGIIYIYADEMLCGFYNDAENDSRNRLEDIFVQLYGNNVYVSGEIVPMKEARNYGNYDEHTVLHSKGVVLKLSADTIQVEHSDAGKKMMSFNNTIARAKIYLKSILQGISSDDEYGILAAMVLGESDEVKKEIKDLYSLSGISHIMAVSGLHISLIGMGIYKILRKKMRYISSATISMGVMSIFLVLIGNPISATRAVIMFLVHMIADLYGRKYDVLSALSLAGILLLLDNPYYLINMSFQLSFMAMMGVTVCITNVMEFVFDDNINEKCDKEETSSNRHRCGMNIMRVVEWAKIICAKLSKIIAFNIALCIVLMPINSFLFFRHSTYSPFVNMIVVPLVGIVVIMSLCGICVAILFPGVGRFIVGTSVYILKFFSWLSEQVISLPYSSIVTGKLLVSQVIICYVLLVACVLIMFLYNEGKLWKRLNKLKIYSMSLVMMGIYFFIIFREKHNGLSVNFLDVGQGSSIYIKSESGNDYLIDGGSIDEKNIGEYKLEGFLEARQVDSLEYVFVTHCDSDHISGIIELMERGNIKIKVLVLPDIIEEIKDDKYWELVGLAKERDITVVYMNVGDELKDGKLKFTCLNPNDELMNQNSGDINESSLVLVMEYKNLACVFTGDIGIETEVGLIRLLEEFSLQEKTVIYDVAHHGSRHSNSREIIDALKPQVSVISCGKDNSYGHPADEVLERLQEVDSDIWCTYERGQIEVYEGKDGFIVRGYLDQYRRRRK